MKVLVCGGRDYSDRERVFEVLDQLDASCHIGCVIQGGARGADALGDAWAEERQRASATFKAPWNALGKRAGPVRNGWMLEYGQPDLVVAFPGGSGTANMVSRAKAAGIEVFSDF